MNYTKSIVMLFSTALIIYTLTNISTNISLVALSNNTTLNAKLIYHGEGNIIGQRILEKEPEGWKTGNIISGDR